MQPFMDEHPTIYYRKYSLYHGFDEYLEANSIDIADADRYIESFVDSLYLCERTKRTYKSVLHKFIQYVYDHEGLTLSTISDVEQDSFEGVKYILHKDGSYEKVMDNG